MRVLVVSATSFEIKPFSENNKIAEVLVSGVGIPSTIFHLTKKLINNKYDLVIQAGIAGSFTKKIKKCEVLIIKQDTFADIGVEEENEFKTIFELGFSDENLVPFEKGWLINHNEIFSSTNLKVAKAITINKISDRKKQTKQMQKKFEADVESMEGAAFHYVCLQQQIPFLQIRSISNYVGERDKKKWKLKESIDRLNDELQKIFREFNREKI